MGASSGTNSSKSTEKANERLKRSQRVCFYMAECMTWSLYLMSIVSSFSGGEGDNSSRLNKQLNVSSYDDFTPSITRSGSLSGVNEDVLSDLH